LNIASSSNYDYHTLSAFHSLLRVIQIPSFCDIEKWTFTTRFLLNESQVHINVTNGQKPPPPPPQGENNGVTWHIFLETQQTKVKGIAKIGKSFGRDKSCLFEFFSFSFLERNFMTS
jgi:hypothetical protein